MAQSSNIENMIPPKERIDRGTFLLMITTVVGLEIFQGIVGALPIAGVLLGPMVGFLIWLTFFIWFKLHGVTMGDNIKRMGIMLAGFFFELIPVLNILPIWTVTIFITIVIVRNEDKKKIKDFIKARQSAVDSRKMGYNINTLTKYVVTGKIANDNSGAQEFKEAA